MIDGPANLTGGALSLLVQLNVQPAGVVLPRWEGKVTIFVDQLQRLDLIGVDTEITERGRVFVAACTQLHLPLKRWVAE